MTSIEWLIEQLESSDTAIARVVGLKKYNKIVNQAKEMHKQEMEISDEEIEKAFTIETEVQTTKYVGEIAGAKWYREQLKSKGNGRI